MGSQHPKPNASYGTSKKPHTIAGGHQAGSQAIHPSLHGEQKPDKSPQGKRTY
jgi:hypothetical protein